MTASFIEGADGLVDLVAPHGAAGFEAVGGGEFTSCGLLGRYQVAEENMPVCQCFFDDQGVGGMVI